MGIKTPNIQGFFLISKLELSVSPQQVFFGFTFAGFSYFSKKVRFLKEVGSYVVTPSYLLSQITDNSNEIQKAEVSVCAGS